MASRANVKNEKQYEALKYKGTSKERAARIANSPGASQRGGNQSGSGGDGNQGGTTAQKKKAGAKGGKAARGVLTDADELRASARDLSERSPGGERPQGWLLPGDSPVTIRAPGSNGRLRIWPTRSWRTERRCWRSCRRSVSGRGRSRVCWRYWQNVPVGSSSTVPCYAVRRYRGSSNWKACDSASKARPMAGRRYDTSQTATPASTYVKLDDLLKRAGRQSKTPQDLRMQAAADAFAR